MNLVTILVMGLVTLALGTTLSLRAPERLRPAAEFTLRQLAPLALQLPLAILLASFLSELLPPAAIAGLFGRESGPWGIVLAALVGGALPGGPMASFPIAVFLWQAGAGPAQTVALLAGWSVFALHRVIIFELPIMGWRFSALRLLACAPLPVLAGLAAALLIRLTGVSLSP